MTSSFFIFDTNVLISAALDSSSTSGLALKKLLCNQWYFIFSDETFKEFSEVLHRKKFDRYFDVGERGEFIEYVLGASKFFNPKLEVTLCPDPKDNMFLSLAMECQAACIVSGDRHLLDLHPFENIPILSPSDFLNF